jgi:hypothetical protein
LGTLREASFPSQSFQVVTLWDVIEHLHTPWKDLTEIHRLLVDGGLLVIRIPNLESLERRWFGPFWLGWDLPRHLYFFPQSALVSALEELGFVVQGFRSIASGYSAFLHSLRFFFQDRFAQARWSQLILRLGLTMPARLMLAPLFWTFGQAKLSSVITLFARKQTNNDIRT